MSEKAFCTGCGYGFGRPGWKWENTGFKQASPGGMSPIVSSKCPGCKSKIELPLYGGILEQRGFTEKTKTKTKSYPEKKTTPDYSPSQVYVIGPVEGAYKIGISRDVESRLNTLQTGVPVNLSLVCSFPGGEFLEKTLHRKFWDKKVRGEWFALSPEDLDELRSMS